MIKSIFKQIYKALFITFIFGALQHFIQHIDLKQHHLSIAYLLKLVFKSHHQNGIL